MNTAIVQQTRIVVPLPMLLCPLADRWGQVRSDGVALPPGLTHAVPADLVAVGGPPSPPPWPSWPGSGTCAWSAMYAC